MIFILFLPEYTNQYPRHDCLEIKRSGMFPCWTRWWVGRKEGSVLFNDALNTFHLQLYGVRHMVKDLSDSERGNLLPLHGLLSPISSKGSFICIITQIG